MTYQHMCVYYKQDAHIYIIFFINYNFHKNQFYKSY